MSSTKEKYNTRYSWNNIEFTLVESILLDGSQLTKDKEGNI